MHSPGWVGVGWKIGSLVVAHLVIFSDCFCLVCVCVCVCVLATVVQQKIYDLQHPEKCENRRLLVCNMYVSIL
jgi:hypothetical protein